jgi:hypothetical protein
METVNLIDGIFSVGQLSLIFTQHLVTNDFNVTYSLDFKDLLEFKC